MAPSRSPHLLVLDDDALMRELLGEIFVEEGYRVSSPGATATLAPAAIADLAPDLILTDTLGHRAEELTAALRALRTEPRLAHTPIVLCTGAVRELKELDGAIPALGVRVVFKPFELDHLLAEVASALAATS